MLKEFKEFIKRGNVMDLAVGVIVGGAFGNIVTSLVNNILTPILGIFLGGIDFSSLTLKVKDANINYGMFLQNVIDFLIIAFCIFIMIKLINKIIKIGKKDEEKKEASSKKEEILLLEEIRDLLKEENSKKMTKEQKEIKSKYKSQKH